MFILDGVIVAAKVKEEVKNEIEKLETKPRLTVIKVGSDPASEVYVRNKIKACKQVGIDSSTILLGEDAAQEELITMIKSLNDNPGVNGILVQLPLPDHMDKDEVIMAIDPQKDVDCFHPVNVGRLYSKNAVLKPCTPAGIIEILKYYNIKLEGRNCAVVGRSDIVGKPVAQLLTNEDATVTVCHSKTAKLKSITKDADIVIAALGKAKFLNKDYFLQPDPMFKGMVIREFGEEKYEEIRRKQVVIDVGINRDENNKLCGDVDLEDIKDFIDFITPVPGGVGPMTIAMLMKNTLLAYKFQNSI